MEDRQKFIDEQCELFKQQMEQALEHSRIPEDLRWVVFSTGSREIEEGVLDAIVSNMLKYIEGVYIFRPQDRDQVIANLETALDELKEKQHEETMANLEKDNYTITLGT